MLMRTAFIGFIAAIATINAQPGGRGPGGGPGGARFIGAQPGMPGRVVKNAPYSAEMVTETMQALADGNRIRQTSTSRIYRDSEGRTRREQSLALNGLAAGSNLPQVVFISDPVAGADYALSPSHKTATKSMRPSSGGGRGRGPEGARRGPEPDRAGAERGGMMRSRGNNPNVKTESLGRQLIEGVPADGNRTTMTLPPGEIGNEQTIQIVSETWYSPELQTTVLSKRSDPRNGETVFKLTNISRAEPPRTMFDVPVDYKVSETSRPSRGGPIR